jgi:hypothetical protein
MCALSSGVYTATLLVMIGRMKGGGGAFPPAPGWAEFTIMIECTNTPESGDCQSI